MPTTNARFDKNGNRLLCRPEADLPFLYNIPTVQLQPSPTSNRVTDRVLLTATDYSVSKNERSNLCFAGGDDELVVASSSNHNLYMWSIPDTNLDRIFGYPLMSLCGHQRPVNKCVIQRPSPHWRLPSKLAL